MAIHGESTTVLEEHEPPFLQEATVAVVQSEPSRPAVDRLVDFVYRWRQALLLGLVPIVLVAVAISWDTATPTDPALTGTDGASQFGAVAAGVSSEETTEAGASNAPSAKGGQAVVLPGPWPDDGDAPLAPSGGTDEPGTAPAPTASSQPPTTAATTTTEPTTTVAPTTTQPATTATEAPPETVAECMVTIRRRGNLRAEPSTGSERLGRVTRGVYAGLGTADDGEWYRIEFQGTIGWVRERLVGDVQGDC